MNDLAELSGQAAATLRDLLGIPFSDEQLAAITAPLAPNVVIAGAGSGKTTVMAARVVWLVASGQVRPDQVLGLTFTRKAAAELSERVDDALRQAGVVDRSGPDDAGEQLVMTYDAFAARLVSDHGLRIGADSDAELITGATRFRLAAQVVADATGPFDYLTRLRPNSLTERVLLLDEQLSQHLIDEQQVVDWTASYLAELEQAPGYRGKPYAQVKNAMAVAGERLELLSLVKAYRQAKTDAGVVEFHDQMAVAAGLVERMPQVGVTLRDQFRVVLLDEYQDTSAAQARLLRALFGPGVDQAGMGHPVTAVGDPYQAIYGWRGASPSNILRFSADFPELSGRPAALYQLSVNRRSDRSIIDLANRLAQPLRADPKMAAAFSSAEMAGNLLPLQLTAAAGKSDGQVQIATHETWPDEVEWIADEIAATHDRGEISQWSQSAVLVRRNADIGAIYQALVTRDIPAEIVGLDGLLMLPGIVDIVDTLRLLADVTANTSVTNLLAGPRWRIGPRDLAALGRRLNQNGRLARQTDGLGDALALAVSGKDASELPCLYDNLSDPAACGLSEQACARATEFRHEIDQLRTHRDEPVLDLAHRVARTLGVANQMLSWSHGEHQLRQLRRFFDHIADFTDRDGQASLDGLLAWFDAELKHGVGLDQAVVSAQDSVKIMTIHRAKGLEYDLVFLPAVVQGTFPRVQVNDNWVTSAQTVPAELRGDSDWVPQLAEATKQAMDDLVSDLKAEAQLSEDRLAYVAATRAKHRLVVSAHHWKLGAARPVGPSQYHDQARQIAELSDGVLLDTELTVDRPNSPLDEPIAWPPPIDEQWRAEQLEVAGEVVARMANSQQPEDHELSPDDALVISSWRRDAQLLLSEARERIAAPRLQDLPSSLSASSAMRAVRDPQAFAAQMIRPMPSAVSRVASVGSRFHAWLEHRFGLQGSFDELLESDTDQLSEEVADQHFVRLCRAFERGQFAKLTPIAVEQDFVLVLDNPGQAEEHQIGGARDEPLLIRGRIDAIYQEGDRFTVVDWKTSNRPADPLQLAIYRLAWAQIMDVPPSQVDAIFYHVAADEVQRPSRLLTAQELWLQLQQAAMRE